MEIKEFDQMYQRNLSTGDSEFIILRQLLSYSRCNSHPIQKQVTLQDPTLILMTEQWLSMIMEIRY